MQVVLTDNELISYLGGDMISIQDASLIVELHA